MTRVRVRYGEADEASYWCVICGATSPSRFPADRLLALAGSECGLDPGDTVVAWVLHEGETGVADDGWREEARVFHEAHNHQVP